MLASIIIRTFNEERYLEELLTSIAKQQSEVFSWEVVIVDSGSTDRTLEIASSFEARVIHIRKEEFTFGRSLNIGCDSAKGDFVAFISGHCIPTNRHWLEELLLPLHEDSDCWYSYGQQVGRDSTKFSEECHFKKFFPDRSRIQSESFFCNNANAATKKSVWEEFKFDELLTGLEDLLFGKQIIERGKKICYTHKSSVFHIHDESWFQVRHRYERESLALRDINPEIQFDIIDFIKCFVVSVLSDSRYAIEQGRFFKVFGSILAFRLMYCWGTYKGNHINRKLSKELKIKYFYPER
ncbi:MAG: glycosyltransferase [Gammaproteobacteria bacterium]|nr:glycosyltransferase [Gammaproteobacteria bacterium]